MASMFGVAMIWGWVPIILMIFASRPPRQAVIFSFVTGWLFLPNISFSLPGIPDWSKTTATVIGAMLGAVIFDGARVFAFRGRWFDIPIAAWCLSPFASSISSGAGPYDGLSAILEHSVLWGMPYLLGRIYCSDAEGARACALGITIGGLAYIPLCLLEMKFSPVLRGWVYGIPRWEGTRYGGFRPAVFLAHGLELGMWMSLACLMAERLWISGAVKRLGGYSFGMLTLILFVVTVFCRSTGALCLLVLGLGTLRATRYLGRSWLVWFMLLIPPTYCTLRTAGLWSGDSLVQVASAAFGDDRAQSLNFRFLCEDNHIIQAWKRPLFGYSRASGYMNTGGKWTEKIVDALWTITLGTMGIVGVVTLNTMLLLPMVLTLRRFPVKTWTEPDVAPTVAMAMFLVLFMIDNLSNAMLNPIFAVALGGVSGMSGIPGRRRGINGAGAAVAGANALADEGRLEEAAEAYGLAAELTAGSEGHPDAATMDLNAEALTGLGRALAGTGRLEDAEHALRGALEARLGLASGLHDPDRLAPLAAGHEELARLLSESGRFREAIAERRKALELWDTLVASRPRDAEYRARRVESLNDLAWLLATDADPMLRDPIDAISLASEASRHAPEDPACWNTLGVARYRAGDWSGAFEALEYSVNLGAGGGTAFDHYFLSMACGQLGEIEHARAWFDLAVEWSDAHRPGHPGLAAFRSEAAAMLVDGPQRSLKSLSS